MTDEKKKPASRWLNGTVLSVAGAVVLLLLALAFLWYGNATSSQSVPAMMAQVYFDGEYRIDDGPWQKITEGEHISSTRGDVTLRGNFHMLAPDGTYVGIYTGDIPIAFYMDHICVTVSEEGMEPVTLDLENPIYGASACGETWSAYVLSNQSEAPLEIRIHNPHRYGNETAVDELLANTALWAGIDFEQDVLQSGEFQRNAGLFFIVVALALLGIALFSFQIHIKNSKIFWLFGLVIFFAGLYSCFSASGVSFWQDSIISNTSLLGFSMMFYMLFLSMLIVSFLGDTRRVGRIAVLCLGGAEGLILLLPMITDLRFYDLWPVWGMVQTAVGLVLLVCLVRECLGGWNHRKLIYIGAMLPLLSFGLDGLMTGLGVWKGGAVSKYVFAVLFGAAMVVVLRIVPQGINAAAKAKELENEKTALNAQLVETRVSTMMSQIRPHFIYNTLGSIEQLCRIDPPKAEELVHSFAKYLRGNFGELDNPKPILMSREMEHVHHYLSIENVRFPDMTFTFEMNSGDFYIPALTVQPIVENAIKHGLMKLPRGGTIRVVSYETDTHYCVSVEDDGAGFDTGVLLDERKHVGIRNIRGRLKAMVNGTLHIESAEGVGTKVLIEIPKEADR